MICFTRVNFILKHRKTKIPKIEKQKIKVSTGERRTVFSVFEPLESAGRWPRKNNSTENIWLYILLSKLFQCSFQTIFDLRKRTFSTRNGQEIILDHRPISKILERFDVETYNFKAIKVKRKYTDQIQQLRGFYSPGKNSLANQVMPKSPVDDTKKMIECYICARVLKEKFKVFTHPGKFSASFYVIFT